MVGIMRGGGAYVPLDPKLPVDRLRYLVEQCGCGVVVPQRKHVGVGGSLGVDVCVAEDVIWDECVSVLTGQGMRCEKPGSLAYVLFTSGSTGKPKGVMVEQGSLVVMVRSEALRNGLKEKDAVLHAITFTFDPSVYLALSPLASGSTVILGRCKTTLPSPNPDSNILTGLRPRSTLTTFTHCF